MDMLVKCGFCFLSALDEYRTLMENKFTGLCVIYDDRTRSHRVLGEEQCNLHKCFA